MIMRMPLCNAASKRLHVFAYAVHLFASSELPLANLYTLSTTQITICVKLHLIHNYHHSRTYLVIFILIKVT